MADMTIKLDVIEGVDRFAAEGDESTVLKLYDAWLKKVEQLQQKSSDLLFSARQAKQVDDAEHVLGMAGIATKRLS